MLPDEKTGARIKELVGHLTREAVDKLKRMREAEGKFMEADLMGHCDAMARELAIVAQRSSSVVTEYASRLRRGG